MTGDREIVGGQPRGDWHEARGRMILLSALGETNRVTRPSAMILHPPLAPNHCST